MTGVIKTETSRLPIYSQPARRRGLMSNRTSEYSSAFIFWMLRAVPQEMNVPGLDFEALRGLKPTRCTVHVIGPWCVTFEFERDNATASITRNITDRDRDDSSRAAWHRSGCWRGARPARRLVGC